MRLASQAVPSPNPVGFYHYGAAIGSLIIKINRVTRFLLSAPLQGSWIGEAKTEGFVSLRSK